MVHCMDSILPSPSMVVFALVWWASDMSSAHSLQAFSLEAREARSLAKSFWLTKVRIMIAFVSNIRDSRFDRWKLALSHAIARFLGKNSIKSMLNKGEKRSLRESGDVVNTVCRMLAAWAGLMTKGWARMFLYSVVFVGGRVETIVPPSQSILVPIRNKLNMLVFSFASCSLALLVRDSTTIFWVCWVRKGGAWELNYQGGICCWFCCCCWLGFWWDKFGGTLIFHSSHHPRQAGNKSLYGQGKPGWGCWQSMRSVFIWSDCHFWGFESW